MKQRFLIASLVAIGAIGSVPRTYAAAPADMAAAESLFQEARELMSKGQFKEACPKLAESQRLDPAVGTLLYLAECYEKNGQTASAWAMFELAAAEGRKDRQEERELMAKQRAQQLLPKLSRLTIGVAEKARVAGLTVSNNGQSVGAASWGSALPVDPGKHRIEATAPGKKPWAMEISISSEVATTQIEVPPLEDAASPVTEVPKVAAVQLQQPPPPANAPVEPAPTYWGTQRILGVGLAGAGVIGIGLGSVFVVSAQGKESDSERYCAPNDPTRCTQRGVDMINDAKSQNTLGNVFLGAGGALLVGGAVLFFTSPKGSEKPTTGTTAQSWTLVPAISKNGGAFLASGQF